MVIKIRRIHKFESALLKRLFGHRSVPNGKFFKNKQNILYVAVCGKEIAGCAWSYLLFHPDQTKPAMFLYSIDVFEPYRRIGVGTALINEIKKLSRKLKCFEIFVLTEVNNYGAIQFYKSTGGAREKPNSAMFVYKLK